MRKLFVFLLSMLILTACSDDNVKISADKKKKVDVSALLTSEQVVDKLGSLTVEYNNIPSKKNEETQVVDAINSYKSAQSISTATIVTQKLSNEKVMLEKRKKMYEALEMKMNTLKGQLSTSNAGDQIKARKAVDDFIVLVSKKIELEALRIQRDELDIVYYSSISQGKQPVSDNYQEVEKKKKSAYQTSEQLLEAYNKSFDNLHFTVRGTHIKSNSSDKEQDSIPK